MGRIWSLSALLLIVLQSFAVAAEPPSRTDLSRQVISLDECLKRAFANSEKLAREEESYRQIKSRYDESRALVLPNIIFAVDERFRNEEQTKNGSRSPDGSVENSNRSIEKEETLGALQINQTIFTGFRDLLLIEAAGSDVRATDFRRRRAYELLYQEVSVAYYDVILYDGLLPILDGLKKTLTKYQREIDDFLKLGKSREADLISTRAELSEIDVRFVQAQLALANAREVLAFLINQPADTIALQQETAISAVEQLPQYLARSEERYDLQASREAVIAADQRSRAAERERIPTVGLQSSLYAFEDPDRNRDWDVLIRVEVPIFKGGAIDARIDQAASQARSARLSASEAKRIVEREVRIAYNNVQSRRLELDRLKTLVAEKSRNTESQRKDFGLGIVNSLEVLTAIRDEYEAKLRAFQTGVVLAQERQKLEVAAGGIHVPS